MIGVMPATRGRGTGRWKRPRLCGGGREPLGDQQSRQTRFQAWRAGCDESRLSGSGRGGWKRAIRGYHQKTSIGDSWQVYGMNGTSLAAYFTQDVLDPKSWAERTS